MNDWFSLLGEAFNESANYFAWSFYSLLSAYIFLVMVETTAKSERKKLVMRASMIVFCVFSLITTANIWFMSLVFKAKLGYVAWVISFTVGFVMIIINAYPVVRSMIDVNKKKDSEDVQGDTESV